MKRIETMCKLLQDPVSDLDKNFSAGSAPAFHDAKFHSHGVKACSTILGNGLPVLRDFVAHHESIDASV